MINCATYNIERLLASVLKPSVGSWKRHAQNTLDFMKKVSHIVM